MLLVLLAAAAAAPSPAEQSAIFTAAGFTKHGAEWRTKDCEGMEGSSYGPGTLDTLRDLNGEAARRPWSARVRRSATE